MSSIQVSQYDNLFKISSLINTQYTKDYNLKDELFDRVCHHLFGMERLTHKLSACFKSWLSLVFDRIKENKNYNNISYSEIIRNSDVKFCLGTCSKLFKTLSDMNLVTKTTKIGQSSDIELDIDALVSMFDSNQSEAEEDLNIILKHIKEKRDRKRRYAVAKKICDSYSNPIDRENLLMKCTFKKGEAFVYDLMDTFYVRANNHDYHITFADVMTVMSGIASIHGFDSTESWDNYIFFKLNTNKAETQKLIDAIKNPNIYNSLFHTKNYFRLVKESYLDSNKLFYNNIKKINSEDVKAMFRNN